MKIIILAGGKGSRLSEYTKLIPKPMVKIVKVPIIVRIIKHYVKYGFKEFIVAAGYKYKIIKKYFKNNLLNLNIKIINTGVNSMTGGRIKILKKYINERFMLTYGDGLCDVNLKKLLYFHKTNKYIATLTAVRPPARFGELKINNSLVKTFKEKPQTGGGWINGGFFITNKNFLNLIKGKKTILEKEPLEKASKKKQLLAFKHNSFWKCMDTLRDKQVLEKMHKQKYF